MGENNFKIGDRVKLSEYGKTEFPDRLRNPYNVIGTITEVSNSLEFNIGIKWDNDSVNCYKSNHLELAERIEETNPKKELVNSPDHYKSNGMEAIDVIEGFGLGFNLGNATKYILRCGKKDDAIQELKKAIWYLEREISNRSEK